jgi:hypothetical protein
MISEYQRGLRAPRVQAALGELQRLIAQHFPGTRFCVAVGQDDPRAIHLIATVVVADRGAVLDTVMDRMMELQIDEGLPIFVVPVRPRVPVPAMDEKVAHHAGRDHPAVQPP